MKSEWEQACNHKEEKKWKCEHKNLTYCNKCKKVHCKDCGEEWGAKEVQYVPYRELSWPNPYWYYAIPVQSSAKPKEWEITYNY